VTLRARFALAAAIPAFASLAGLALLADALARRALEDELGAKLTAVAEASAAALPADRVATLQKGDETTRTFANLRARLDGLARATKTRLVVARLDRTALLDSEGAFAIGAGVPGLERDRFELSEVAKGRSLPSQVLFEGKDGRSFKTGYAPLSDGTGAVIAVVSADGSAEAFEALGAFRRLLLGLAVLGGVLGGLIALFAALTVSRPLADLSRAAQRIGAGDLATPLSQGRGGEEVALLARTLEEMRRSLRARDEERETMLAGIAHEIRNPLGGIDLFAGLLAEEMKGSPAAEHAARIQKELGTLQGIVEDFLDFARVRPLALEPVEAAGFASEVAELSRPLAEEQGVRLAASGEGTLNADRERLRRAVLNLVRNAIEASPRGETVELSIPGGAEIRVADRGPGLTPEAREKLFSPFFSTKERGTGLGLPLARKVAAAHGGSLELVSREGGGTLARLAVPRSRG
jgi:signal transduction histidine kinase